MIVHSVLYTSQPATRDYIASYTAKYKVAPNGFSPSYYDFTNMLFESMRRAGTVTNSDKVAQELARLSNFDGVLGKLSWTGKESYGIDQQLAVPFYVAEIKNGVELVRARCTIAEGCR